MGKLQSICLPTFDLVDSFFQDRAWARISLRRSRETLQSTPSMISAEITKEEEDQEHKKKVPKKTEDYKKKKGNHNCRKPVDAQSKAS